MNTALRKPSSAPLAPALRERLANLVSRRGEKAVAESLPLPRTTLARACAGFGLRTGSALMIEQALDRIERKAA